MVLRHIALVSETDQVSAGSLDAVAAALQIQVLRDLGPAWGVTATVDAFASLDDIPITYYPMFVRDDLPIAAAGVHLDADFTPFALVRFSNRWSLTASHEICEMLVDPFGNRLHPGVSLKDDQGVVEYLVEVCDPSEAVEFSYRINGIVVSDFYLPSFFDPVTNERVAYSFTGACRTPLEVREGGYLSWRNPVDNRWWQQIWFDTANPVFRDLGVFDASQGDSFRNWLDRRVLDERRESVDGVAPDTEAHDDLVAAYALAVHEGEGTTARAQRLRSHIDGLVGS